MKAAIVVLSDPANGEEALGRLFNALAAARDLRERSHQVQILFHGTGTRWAAALERPGHPAAGLYEDVRGLVVGASCGCADVFGAREGVQSSGLALLTDNPVPGTSGLGSLARLVEDGYHVVTF
jgi:hypothetical protein